MSLAAVESANLGGDIVHLGVAERRIHGKKETTPEQQFGARKKTLETEGRELMDSGAAPLDDGFYAVGFKVLPQFIAMFGFDLIVLENIEMIG
jgi:hypothetical protein